MSEGGADSVRRVGQVWLQVQQELYTAASALTISASDVEELEHE